MFARAKQFTESEIFKLPVGAARQKVREIIAQKQKGGLVPIVENWRQLPDGHIELVLCARFRSQIGKTNPHKFGARKLARWNASRRTSFISHRGSNGDAK